MYRIETAVFVLRHSGHNHHISIACPQSAYSCEESTERETWRFEQSFYIVKSSTALMTVDPLNVILASSENNVRRRGTRRIFFVIFWNKISLFCIQNASKYF